MNISIPNHNGVLPEGIHDVVARSNRSYVAVNIAFCEDGLYRKSVELRYSYGGSSGPIFATAPGYATAEAARTAALQEVLQRWPRPFPSDPVTAQRELADLLDEVQAQLSQPSLF